MRTEDLIRHLSRAPAPRPDGSPTVALMMALGLGVMIAALLAGYLGLRGDVRALAPDDATLIKVLGAFAVMIAAGSAALRLSAPGTSNIWRVLACLSLLGVMAAGALQSGLPSLSGPGTETASRLVVLSIPGLVLCLVILRKRAAVSPALTGASAGLMAAGSAAIGYALHCPAEVAGFIAQWYGLAALVSAALGAVLGRHVLAW